MKFNKPAGSIGGVLDYAVLARKHMPTDPQALRAEIRRLADTGLKPIDIATALRISLPLVQELLRT